MRLEDVTMSSKDSVRRSFGERASEWAACYSDGEPRTQNLMARQRFALQLVEASLPHSSKILDAGCGPGGMAAKLMQHGYEVWGLDIAEPMISHAREACGTNRFRVGDVERIPFPDDAFDGVVCLGVLPYLDADAKALSEIERVLKPGGIAVVSTPSATCPLYHVDRVVAAAERLYAFAKHRFRDVPLPARPASLRIRMYRRGSWLRLLRSVGLEPEEWLSYGWGWYSSRLGASVERLSRSAARSRRGLERLVGGKFLRQAEDRLARSRVVNWIPYEQMVRVRAAK
jgi:SAM-dependent methyltransferase